MYRIKVRDESGWRDLRNPDRTPEEYETRDLVSERLAVYFEMEEIDEAVVFDDGCSCGHFWLGEDGKVGIAWNDPSLGKGVKAWSRSMNKIHPPPKKKSAPDYSDKYVEEWAAHLKECGVKSPPCCSHCWGEYQDNPEGWRRTEPCGYCAAAYSYLVGMYRTLGKSFWKEMRIKEGLME
jgi:hypothetical protein